MFAWPNQRICHVDRRCWKQISRPITAENTRGKWEDYSDNGDNARPANRMCAWMKSTRPKLQLEAPWLGGNNDPLTASHRAIAVSNELTNMYPKARVVNNHITKSLFIYLFQQSPVSRSIPCFRMHCLRISNERRRPQAGSDDLRSRGLGWAFAFKSLSRLKANVRLGSLEHELHILTMKGNGIRLEARFGLETKKIWLMISNSLKIMSFTQSNLEMAKSEFWR